MSAHKTHQHRRRGRVPNSDWHTLARNPQGAQSQSPGKSSKEPPSLNGNPGTLSGSFVLRLNKTFPAAQRSSSGLPLPSSKRCGQEPGHSEKKTPVPQSALPHLHCTHLLRGSPHTQLSEHLSLAGPGSVDTRDMVGERRQGPGLAVSHESTEGHTPASKIQVCACSAEVRTQMPPWTHLPLGPHRQRGGFP